VLLDGTGASIAANKVDGVARRAVRRRGDRRAAPGDGTTPNVLALSLRTTSEAVLGEILDAWFDAGPSDDEADVANVRHLDEI